MCSKERRLFLIVDKGLEPVTFRVLPLHRKTFSLRQFDGLGSSVRESCSWRDS